MSYFLINKSPKVGGVVSILDNEAKHIALSRRVNMNETIIVQSLDKKRYSGKVVSRTKKSIDIKILGKISSPPEPKMEITVILALVKEKPLGYIIQKITELGAKNLIIFPSLHSPIGVEKIAKRLVRWQKISDEAAKQSDRISGVKIYFKNNLEGMREIISENEVNILLDKNGAGSFVDFKDKKFKRISIIIGPEGGLHEKEIKIINSWKNVHVVRLGPRILRVDTAAVSSITLAQALFGDLN